MSFEAALAKRLLVAAAIADVVGTRVDWMRRVQGRRCRRSRYKPFPTVVTSI
ncbi:hypothetical protein [Sphingomonas hankookensis]|uniref:hypothetical protein n=1 Tax=Sphingomonas hankookensis TaxID=563996 RepID=UPI003D301E5E